MTRYLQKPTPVSVSATRGMEGAQGGAVNRLTANQLTVNRLIVIVLFEGVDLLDVTGPPEVFSLVPREDGGAGRLRGRAGRRDTGRR